MSTGGYSVGNSLGGLGTVTSVGLTMPSIFSVSGSPVTTAGTLAAALIAQAANKVFAGPASGADAVPTFRVLTATDIPDLSSVYAKLASDNVFSSTGYQQISKGTTAQQPGSPATGMMRFNTTTGRFEFYNGAWVNYVQLAGDTMTGTLTAPTVALTASLTLLDTTQKVALSVVTANTLLIGTGFSFINTPCDFVPVGNQTQDIGSSAKAWNGCWVIGIRSNNSMSITAGQATATKPLAISTASTAVAVGSAALNMISITTGNCTNAGAGNFSGNIPITTGNVTNGTSGDISLIIGTGTTRGGIALLGAGSFGSGQLVVSIANASVDPTANPVGGGILYVSGGALKYRGSSGTVTTIAAA